MENKPQIPRLETPQTAHIRASYPTIEYLENDYIADWLKERCDQLLELASEERSGINANKLISGAVLTTGFFLHALSPLAPVGVVLGLVGYIHGCFIDANRTGSFSPLPFVRGNILDLAGTLGNADLREATSNETDEFEQLQHYLSPRERKEYEFLNTHFALLTDYLTQVEPLKRFHAYRWIFDSFLQFKGALPSKEQVKAHLLNVTPDLRVDSCRLAALLQHRAQIEAFRNDANKAKFIEPQPIKYITDEQLYSGSYKENLPPSQPLAEPSKLHDEKQMHQNALDILQGLVANADASKLGGCVILAAPGAGKTTYLGTAWGRLKQAYGDRFNSLAIVVKESDVKVFQGVSDNCLCVKDDTVQVAIAIMKFIARSMKEGNSINRLFLDDFLTMNEYFDLELGGVLINTKTYEVCYSKKEDPEAKPLFKALNTKLNELWLVGRQFNSALWVSSHSSNVESLPFAATRESRSVGDFIFLAHNDKREFIEQALNNPNLIGNNIRRQEIAGYLNNVKSTVREPLILGNFNNWTFGIVSSEVHDEYLKRRKEWETVEPTTLPGEKLSDVIQNLEKSLKISNVDEASSEETSPQGEKPEDLLEEEPILLPRGDAKSEQTEKELSDLAKRLLSFFDNAKNKEPKSLADLKKKDELREHGDIKLIVALTELVTASKLIFDNEDSWSKSDW